eukprot:CAMPEP_0196716796 /NCGR_PEP_ID=MMETSP1091-20130531/229_1 /TAXON_ID=302021 /ORGANISM="Rhodomonas sp., Strain CCMP768" /LENGTH=52 /DNA_ID=CAMNT_0042056949 /DNA_START=27 /DNA_END=185 /DNA_ORIENTATION=-
MFTKATQAAAASISASQARKIAAMNSAGYEDKFATEKHRMGDAHMLGVTMGM